MALTSQQKAQVAATWAMAVFVVPNVVANFNTDDIVAAVTALDNALDTTLNAAVAAVGGTTTIINGLAQIIPAPFSAASASQKTILLNYVLAKRVGLI